MSDDKLIYTINEFCTLFGISRSTFYGLVRSGALRPSKILGKTIITRNEAKRFAASLEVEEAAE